MLVTYFIDNKLGGVTSLNYNLTAHPLDLDERQCVIHIEEEELTMSRADIHFPVDKEVYFRFSLDDNTYHTLKTLRKLIPDEEGALVLNYGNEMAMLDHYPVRQTTYQLVHDNYNYKLAIKYGHVVDVFICHNSDIYQRLLDLYPERKGEIFYLPHGVPLPPAFREADIEPRPLQLVFLGRMTSSKGIYDLLVINDLLRANKIEFEWTCIGNGPELGILQKQWNKADKVSFISPASNAEVLVALKGKDIFVLPTKFEGTPVSLLETMSVGLVPVITNLPGGITDIVDEATGFKIEMDNNKGFAEAIKILYHNREMLNSFSKNAREKIIRGYNVSDTAVRYHELFMRYREFYKSKSCKRIKVGARLDQPFFPTSITKSLRKISNKFK